MRKLIVVLAVCALVVSFSTASFAEMKGAATNIYGRVVFDTFRDYFSATLANTNFDDTDTFWMMDQSHSRMGINFKAGDVGAHWEWRPNPGSTVRHFYGTWNFGQGTLVVGQTWDPIFFAATCNQVGRASGTYTGSNGNLAGCLRVPQITIRMKGFTLAFITPSTRNISGAPAAAWDIDTTWPRFTATYTFKWQPFFLNLIGGYQTYTLANKTTDQEVNVDGYVYGVHVGYVAGPFDVEGLAWYSQNSQEFGLFGYLANQADSGGMVNTYGAVLIPGTATIIDANITGWSLTGAYKVNDMFTLRAGWMGTEARRDRINAVQVDVENKSEAYYFNVPITLAKNVIVTPEIGKIDEKDQLLANGIRAQDGEHWWWGVQWYIGW